MKGNRPFIDIGTIFDEIFDAAREFSGEFQKNFDNFKSSQQKGDGSNTDFEHKGPFWGARDEGVDFYPAYSYPPMNVWMGRDRQMVFEFALAGFSEKNINLSFQGDYMIFSAKSDVQDSDEDRRYFKRRLKFKDIERQKYYRRSIYVFAMNSPAHASLSAPVWDWRVIPTVYQHTSVPF